MGWAMLAGFALVTAVALWLGGFPRRLWTIPATALTLGAAGYAWQGSPELAGHPVTTVEEKGQVDPGLVELREAMFGRFNYTSRYFGAADAMTRIGARGTAVRVMLGAVHDVPQSAALWTGLGMALADNDNGMVSPSAKYAFDKAMELSPEHPGPPFFLGMAYVRSGQFAAARPLWVRAVELAPAGASYRAELEAQLTRLEQFVAERGAGSLPVEREGSAEGVSGPAPATNQQALP
ncbi:MAG: cytochrome c biogenesis factor-like protein [Sphingomonas sp.]